MHGRVKKDVVEPTEEEREKQKEQVRTARALFAKLLEQRHAKVYSQQALDMTAKALQFHPEFPTLWGYRRELLDSDSIQGDRKELLHFEMKLLEKALSKTQKVYSIWFHRRWVVERLFKLSKVMDERGESVARSILDTELGLCGRLLEVDERNFHCWNHRAHVMALMRRSTSAHGSLQTSRTTQPPEPPSGSELAAGLTETSSVGPAADANMKAAACGDAAEPPETDRGSGIQPDLESAVGGHEDAKTESCAVPPALDLVSLDLKLSTDLINRNFSNYSAWHLRALLQQQQQCGCGTLEGTEPACPIDVASELDWVQQGIYTEPNDQSVWLYHHWLTTLGRGCETASVTHCAILDGQLFVFFSKPVCAQGKLGSPSPQATLTVLKTCTGALAADPVQTINGDFKALGPDASGGPVRTRTRSLPAGSRRWSVGWRFVPDGDAQASSIRPRIDEIAEVKVDVPIEVLGTGADFTPTQSWQCISFSGPVLQAGSMAETELTGGSGGDAVSPVLGALLGAKPETQRAAMLHDELARIEELLEIEPDCRWALLAKGRLQTVALLERNPGNVEDTEKAVAEGYERMKTLDPLRAGFYSEARSGCLLRVRVLGWLNSAGGLRAPLDISGLGLRHLVPTTVFAAFGVRILDVRGNELQSLGPLLFLRSLQELSAARNRLRGDVAEVFALPHLRRLDVSHNSMEIRAAAAAPPASLEELDLSNNCAIATLEQSGFLDLLLAGVPQSDRGAWTVAPGPVVLRRGHAAASDSG